MDVRAYREQNGLLTKCYSMTLILMGS
ncbi:BnaA01g05650D [Brassica napus]|uniref:BnaA01g05650D protein n=1 Tax=Brassica napus TaxID=3708 RepID=A0A078HZ47_BRANA|nr:BnaA01g05650D [Brassica napus]